MSSNKAETQTYKVVQTEPNFEIRFYPAVTMATITSSAKSYKELGNSGFRKLAAYIFGGNEAKRQISMTTPVHMDINDTASSMSFVMPLEFNKDNLPKPNDSNVEIKTTTDEYVAVITFGGFASDKKIKFYQDKLETELRRNSISYYGNFRFLGYNPPYQLFGRKNEVIVNVDRDPS
ncbi:MAG: heme-binding protein [Bacteroidota bacterium]|uniref:SOUL family heme-binding protein n=1 Tax=Runella sp. TaxID=1960881 RepID=UPI003016FFC4